MAKKKTKTETAKRKTCAQLDREIADALARPKRNRIHHTARRYSSDNDWDVAMDAIMEGDPKKAAKIAHNLRHEHGYVTVPNEFSNALLHAGTEVWSDFERYSNEFEAKNPTPKTPYYRDFTLRIIQPDKKIAETYFRASHPMSFEAARERFIAAGSVDAGLWHRSGHPGGWDLRVSTESEIKDHRARMLP